MYYCGKQTRSGETSAYKQYTQCTIVASRQEVVKQVHINNIPNVLLWQADKKWYLKRLSINYEKTLMSLPQ